MPAWLIAFITHWSSKAIITVLAFTLVFGGMYVGYRHIANVNYHKGYSQALTDHPQNVYNGPTTVNQGRKMGCFPIKIGHFGLGFCHD